MEFDARLDRLLGRPLFETLWRRRTHRVSRGVQEVMAGTMTYQSDQKPLPLDELEEAILIAATGRSGLTMPDRPLQDPSSGQFIMAKPSLTMHGRTSGSPDNAQGTHFIMINDSGTYFLRKPPAPDVAAELIADLLIERARQAKVQLLPKRIDVPGSRAFPAYLDSNRFLSNLPGPTIFFPVVDLSHQYINGLMYLLTEPDGARPTLVDDRNFYRLAGVKKWVRNGFLNEDIKLPLGVIGTLRTQIEADLLVQNLMLLAEAMGLGAWIHASISPEVLLGDPKFRAQYGPMLGFEFATPPFKLLDILRWQVPLPKYADLRSHPIGLKQGDEYLIKAMCPPNYASMADAVAEVVRLKFGPGGIYNDDKTFAEIFKSDFGAQFLKEAQSYSADVIDCVRDVCEYIYSTHRRFPAHVDALYAPGIWIQVHHPDLIYYDRFFRNGLTDAQRSHGQHWHEIT
jgi:nitroreductase